VSDAIFSRRTLAIVVVTGAVSLLAGFAAAIFTDTPSDVDSNGADSFSSSAVGHRALIELLEHSGRRVVRSRGRSAAKAADHALLLLLEPPAHAAERLSEMLAHADHCLVVLPKWSWEGDLLHPDWIRAASLLPAEAVEGCWHAAGGDGPLARLAAPPASWRTENLLAMPSLPRPQLVQPKTSLAAIGCDEGALLVELPARPGASHWVLTDPDLLANHGIGRGDNARLCLEILDRAGGGERTIVVDETLHGHAAARNLWRELGRFPLVLVLVQSLLAIAVLVWSASFRFGRPQPDLPALAAGKELLIDNTAGLLLHGGHAGAGLRRYLELNVRRVAAAYHLRAELEPPERRARLERIGAGRGASNLEALERQVTQVAADRSPGAAARVVRAARRVRTWTTEMLDGHR
jgi:hypothetical protein